MKDDDAIDVYKSDIFIMEVEKIFHFSELENIDKFSEEDYQFFLYLAEHWKRVLDFFPSAPEDMQIPISEEFKDIKKEIRKNIEKIIFKIKKKYKYLDDKFDFEYLEDKFFQRYEDITNRQLQL